MATETAATKKGVADEKASKPEQTPTPSPEPDFWHRETMTGDWGGTRTRWKEKKGIEFEFGIEYAFTDLSEVLKDNLDPLNLRRLRPEHQVEMFYNFHLTPWLRLTGDLQVIRPTRPIATTAIVPGLRLEMIF